MKIILFISRTPYRLSFYGGSLDYKEWYEISKFLSSLEIPHSFFLTTNLIILIYENNKSQQYY